MFKITLVGDVAPFTLTCDADVSGEPVECVFRVKLNFIVVWLYQVFFLGPEGCALQN